MKLTEKQEKSLSIAIDRYKRKEKRTVISGYAGSGKSTLVSYIIKSLPVSTLDVAYASYTGKAAEVLRKKGNPNSTTLHKLLYVSMPTPDGGFKKVRKKSIDYKVVVVDECSMVPAKMIEELESFPNIYIIYLGDPFQLPPINKKEANTLLDKPDCFLDEIMRQAQESDIIKASMDVRAGRSLKEFKGNDIQVINKSELSTGMLLWADQILVATNKTKNDVNMKVRELQGLTGELQNGDKVICSRNYWDVVGEGLNDGDPLINGTTGRVYDPYESFLKLPPSIGNGKRIDTFNFTFCDEDNLNTYSNIFADKNLLINGEKTLDNKQEYSLNRTKKNYLIPFLFEYGYAITVHKAQGSQWDKVLIFEERFPFSREEHARWLYTAITRSSGKVILVK